MQTRARIRQLSGNSSRTFSALAILAVLLFVGGYVLFKTGRLDKLDLEAMGHIATSSGLILVAAGVVLAAAALSHSARSTDLRIQAARKWLENRRRMVAELDYAMFASPYVLDELRRHSDNIDAAPDDAGRSEEDVAKAMLATISHFRRLRDAVADYPGSQGFGLTSHVMQKLLREQRGDSEKLDELSVYTNAYSSTPKGIVATNFLRHNYPWLFGDRSDGIELSPRIMHRAYVSLMLDLDYLDQRVQSLSAVLENGSKRAMSPTDCSPSSGGRAQYEALVSTLKDIYCHVTVMRAWLEVEWLAAFPRKVAIETLENAIAAILEEGDWESFVEKQTGSGNRPDPLASFRFGHALLELGRKNVFDNGTVLFGDAKSSFDRARNLYPFKGQKNESAA